MNANSENSEKTNSWNKLLSLKDRVRKEAEMLVRKDEMMPKFLQTADWLRRVLDLETRHQELLAQAERLISELDRPQTQNEKSLAARGENEAATSQRFGGKPRAEECAFAYVARERKRGKILREVSRGYYSTDTGLIIGITASENKDKKDVWFLNRKDGQFQEAVLLCEKDRDSVYVIHLPKSFLDRHTRQMSRDKKGQIKFNIERRNGTFSLQVPKPIGRLDVTDYVESEPLICPRRGIAEFA
jgi:hypothetical protein